MNRLLIAANMLVVLLTVFVLGTVAQEEQPCNCVVEVQNCAVPLTSLNGQGYQLSGVTGGLTLDTSVAAVDPLGWISGSVNVTENTAILVIDSFRTDTTIDATFTIPEDVSLLTTDAELEAAYTNGQLAHGKLVFNHISALIQGALGSDLVDRDEDSVTWETGLGKLLTVQMVDALNYGAPANTSDVANHILSAITDLQGDSFVRFILNMSFAVLPCNIANAYAAAQSNDPTLLFDEYIMSLDGAETFYYEQFITPVESLFNPDPLHYVIGQCGIAPTLDEENSLSEGAESTPEAVGEIYDLPPGIDGLFDLYGSLPCGKNSLHFVGSAGNSRLPYPFYPAAYPQVDSVSAGDGNPMSLSSYSNYNADMGLAGGWFRLFAFTDPPVDDVTMVELPIFYRGTSFSGPVRSVCLALNISSDHCASFRPS